MASPPSLQPKQCHTPSTGRTWNDGDFSSWNGHRPLRLPTPAGRSVTCSRTTSSIDVRSLTSATSSALIRPATRPPVSWASLSAASDAAARPAIGQSVVVARLDDHEILADDGVDEAVLLVDAARPEAREVSTEPLRLADASAWGSRRRLDQP